MQNIRFTKLIFQIQMQEDCELTTYKVSALRGGMGQMLLAQNCVNSTCCNHCETCMYHSSCIVQKVMYAPFKLGPAANMPKKSLGYIINCYDMRRRYHAGDRLTFELFLFGDAISFVMPIIYAFSSLGGVGLGEKHARFQLISIKNRKGDPILLQGNINLRNLLSESLWEYVEERMRDRTFEGRVVFDSPYCIKHQGKELINITSEALVMSLRRRIYMLSMYEGIEIALPSYEPEELPNIVMQSVEQKIVTRYSSTKNKHMALKGMQGYIELEKCSDDILKLLYAGEIVHIGKNIHFGFGSMKVE